MDLLCVDREFCAAQLSTVGMRVAMASRAWHAHGYGRRRTGSEGVDAMLDLLAVMAHSLRAEVDALPHGAICASSFSPPACASGQALDEGYN